jgi:hypothetical protein
MAPAPGPVWRRCPEVLWRRSLDAVVLLPPDADDPVALPGTGAAVWDLLAEPVTLPDLVATLTDAYGGDPATIEHDVVALLDRLETLGAVDHA